MYSRPAILGVVLIAVVSSAPVVFAHPFHVSIAQADLDLSADAIEVSLRVNPDDLEDALRRRTGRHIVLETEPDADQLIADYLRETIVLRHADVAEKLRWVGKELSVQAAWLYFVLEHPEPLDTATLSNRVLFDVLTGQTNTVNLTIDGRLHTLIFTAARPAYALDDLGSGTAPREEIDASYFRVLDTVDGAKSLSRTNRAALGVLAAAVRAIILVREDNPPAADDSEQPSDPTIQDLGWAIAQRPVDIDHLADIAIRAARRGDAPLAFNVARAVVAAVAHGGADSAPSPLPLALKASAALAELRHDEGHAGEFGRAAIDSRDEALIMLGEARHYIEQVVAAPVRSDPTDP